MENVKKEKSKYTTIAQYKKSNTLISSKYKSSLLENKMLALGLSHAYEENGRIVSKIQLAELKKLLMDDDKKTSGSFYSKLKEVAYEMTDRKVFIENREEGKFVIVNLIGVASYCNNEFTIKFEPDLTDFLLNVKSNYTNFDIPILMSFKRVYSYRLYEILKSATYDKNRNWENKNEEYIVKFPLSELKVSIGVVNTSERCVAKELIKPNPDFDYIVNHVSQDKTFDSWGSFRDRVIVPSVEEINNKTDINVTYDTERSGIGGKTSFVRFYITKKDSVDEKETVLISKNCLSEEEKNKKIQEVVDYIEEPITTENATAFLRKSHWDVQYVKDIYNLANNQEEIQNLVGWMISAINNHYGVDNIHKVDGYSYASTVEFDKQFQKLFAKT